MDGGRWSGGLWRKMAGRSETLKPRKENDRRSRQPTLTLNTLGRLEIRWGDRPVTDLRSRKEQALLVYLAMNPGAHSRSRLAGLLWGDLPEGRARRNLRRALWSLRQHLDPQILAGDRISVGLSPRVALRVDALTFEALTEQAERCQRRGQTEEAIGLLQRAIRLYKDDFLARFDLPGCLEFEEWMLRRRAWLRQQVLEALAHLAVYHAQRREYERAIEYTRRQLAIEPWWEEAHRQMMRLLALNGQRSAALAQYETCRRILTEELGVEPLAETKALYERIRSAPPAPYHNLPPQPTPFVGREEELAAIAQRLANPSCRLLTIVGPGGIGKTRLAIQAATEAAATFLNGVCFVPLTSVISADFLVPAIAQALGFSFHGSQDPKAQLLSYLHDREMLLVLDGFEHLLAPTLALPRHGGGRTPSPALPRHGGGRTPSPALPLRGGGGTGLVVEILQHAPDVKILVTSRERLNLRWEWLLQVEGLAYPDLEIGNSQSEIRNPKWSAVQLFLQSARRVDWRFALVQEAGWVVRICQLMEGMPLGIELAAAWVRERSCREIAQTIERNLGFLAASFRDMPPRHRSMRAAFDHSWHLLSEEEQRVFRRLSVFRGGFQDAAAVQVTGASHRLLASLADKSLLRRLPSGRYELHELLRRYGAERLREAGEETSLRRRHLSYFVTLAERAQPELERPEQEAWLRRLEVDHDNLRAALDWSIRGGEAERGLRLAAALWRFWEVLGHLKEGCRWLEELLARAGPERTPASVRAKALQGVGRLLWCQGEYDRAATLLQESLALFRELGDRQGIADSLNNLGLVAWHRSDYGRATAAHEEALALRRQLGDKRGIASSLGNLAIVTWHQGDYERARALYTESLALFRELEDKQNVALSLNNLAVIAVDQGEYEQAATLLEESLALFQELGFKQGIAWSLGNLGQVARGLKEYDRAASLYGKSLALLRELGDRQAMASTIVNIGHVALAQGDHERAAALYQEALTIQWELRERRDMAECLEALAAVADEQGQVERAARLFGAAEALREEVGAPLPPADRARYEQHVAAVRAELDEETFESTWAQGRAMPLEQAVAYALDERLVP